MTISKGLENTKGLINGSGTSSVININNKSGLVNGNGLTNGNGFTNGNNAMSGTPSFRTEGITNGNNFTNGAGTNRTLTLHNSSGLVNGNNRTGRSKRQIQIDLIRSKMKRERIISILIITVIILLPLSLYINDVPFDRDNQIMIDGEFDDWEGTTSFKDSKHDQSVNPNVDLANVRLKPNYETGSLSFFMMVNGIMLKGKQVTDQPEKCYGVDTINIFIDTDTSPETGYSVQDLGADHMIHIQGYNNYITGSELFTFDNNRDNFDWNGWVYSNDITSRCRDRRLEARVWVPGLIGYRETLSSSIICFHIQDIEGNGDWSDSVVSPNEDLLLVDQKTIEPVANEWDNNNIEILELEFESFGSEKTINSLEINRIGTAGDEATGQISYYVDNGNNMFDYEDQLISSTEFENGRAHFQFGQQLEVEKGEPIKSFIVAEVVDNPLDCNTFGMELSSQADIVLSKEDQAITLNPGINDLKYLDPPLSNEIIIDSAFGDWHSVQSQFDFDESSINNDNINMNEYKIVQNSEEVSFYFQVEGSVMGGTYIPIEPDYVVTEPFMISDNPKVSSSQKNLEIRETIKKSIPLPELIGEDQAYIFIDTDLNVNTGLPLEEVELGADYLVLITGKNGMIISHNYYKFIDTQDRYILNSNSYDWTYSGEVPVGLGSSRLETQLDLAKLGLGNNCEGVKVYFYIEDWHQTRDAIPGYTVTSSFSDDTNYNTRGSGQPLNELVSGVGAGLGDGFGWNVSTAGDVNKDGYSDFIIGAPFTDALGNDAGSVYLFYGFPGIGSSKIDAVNANVSIKGNVGGDLFCWDVACAGDLNADGYDDIIVGAPGNDSNRGTVYIFYGRNSKTWQGGFYAYNANVTITGDSQGDKFGYSVAGAGNVNADEFDDVIIGAPGCDSNKGKAYIFLGYGGGLNDIVTGSSDSRIFVHKGKYGGGWLTPLELWASSMPISVVVADVNNDGYNDIVSADYYGHRVTIFNGTSTGGWEPKCELKGDQYPRSVVVADVNNDNLNDIVSCHDIDDVVNIFNGSGGGGWSAISTFSVGQGPTSVYVGDANNDGKNDFVTANNDDDTITLYNWTGSTWSQKTTFSTGAGPRSIVIADANYDTYNDILTADGIEDKFTIYNGTSGGGWDPKYNKTVGDGPSGIFVADVNKDGYNDTLTSDFNDGTVTIYNGTVSGDWGSKYTKSVGTNPRSVFVGDANNDGYMDILTADFGVDRVSIYNCTSSGGWEPRGVVDGGNGPYSVVVGDVNSAKVGGTFQADDADYVLVGTTVDSYFGNSVSGAGDMNGNGYDDVIIGAFGDNSAFIYFGGTEMGLCAYSRPSELGTLDTTAETGTDDLKIDDDQYFDVVVAKSMFIDSFDITALSGNVTKAMLHVQYYTDASYAANDYIEWALDAQAFSNTDIQLVNQGSEFNAPSYDLYSQGVNTLEKISTLDIRLNNTAGGGNSNVHFDYILIEVEMTMPRAKLVINGTNDFGWAVSNAGDVNGDNLGDIIIGAPDISGATPGTAYIKYGNYQGLDNETKGNDPLGWNNLSTPSSITHVSDDVDFDNGGNSVKFWNADNTNYARIIRNFPAVSKGIIEVCARSSHTDAEKFIICVTNNTYSNGNEAVKVSLGHAGSPSNRISYYDGNGINGFTRKIINLFEADTWYHFRIQFDCDNNNFDVYINGKLEITGGNFINNKTTLNAFYLGQQYGDPTHTEYTDNMVWLGSNTHVNLTGAVAGDRFGYSVATAGDLNNDGFENIIVGAPYNDTAKGQTSDAGAVYIFNGSSGLTDTSAGSADNISYGKTANDHFGWSVSKAGNIDGNSVLEVMVGAPHFNDGVKTDAGKVYILTTGTVISEFVDLALPLSLLLIIITFNKYKFKKRKKKVR